MASASNRPVSNRPIIDPAAASAVLAPGKAGKMGNHLWFSIRMLEDDSLEIAANGIIYRKERPMTTRPASYHHIMLIQLPDSDYAPFQTMMRGVADILGNDGEAFPNELYISDDKQYWLIKPPTRLDEAMASYRSGPFHYITPAGTASFLADEDAQKNVGALEVIVKPSDKEIRDKAMRLPDYLVRSNSFLKK